MADLDDFFAKKDRKKTKAKRFATSDELAKKLEDTTKKSETKLRKDPQPAVQSTTQLDGGVEAETGDQLSTITEVSSFNFLSKIFTNSVIFSTDVVVQFQHNISLNRNYVCYYEYLSYYWL